MRVRAFTVPFSKIVGDDAPEIEYGPEDVIVFRPLFGLPSGKAQQWSTRIDDIRKAARAEGADQDAVSEAVDTLVLDLIAQQVDAWRLAGPDGPIPKPASRDDLEALPFTLRAALFPFFANYRGDAPNPTTSG